MVFTVSVITLIGCGGASDRTTDVEMEIGTARDFIRNGTIVTPFAPGAAPIETQAIVRLGGCTGTVVNPEWVLTAKHCRVAVGATVSSVRISSTVTRTVDRVVEHPSLDLEMLHLNARYTDLPQIRLYSDTTASLNKKPVSMYGYGAKSTSTTCSTTSNCASGEWCQYGLCMRSSSELRRGDATAVYSDDNTFLTPVNGAGQMVLPGDSGGPTFQSGALAGVNDFMYLDLSGGGQVSVPAAREWILATTATFTNYIPSYPAGWNFGLPSAWKTITGDFNGDGRTDYARLGASYSHLFISNGDGTFAAPIESYPSGWDFGLPSSGEPITGDFRGNKKTGYLRLGSTYSHLFMVD